HIHMTIKSSRAPHNQKVLIVDDEALIRFGLEKFLKQEGYTTISAGSGKKALELIEDQDPDIALLDLKLQDAIDGIELLSIIKKTRPKIIPVMISGQTEIHGAVQAMKLGARDYLEKPIDFDKLKAVLESISQELDQTDHEPDPSDIDLIFASDKMRKVVAIMKRLALKSDLTILILGESGTGKNYLCQKIHEMSSRHDAPYVQIGCSNMPDHLIESELFGYEKGAFTDAKASKKGLIEVAEGGTVLLDELGDMPYQFQTKILKLLEERCFRRIGALEDTQVDIRILAATNRDLKQEVQEKKFRLDLFYRLNIATIELPALRERPEDIPVLINNFLNNFCSKYDTGTKTISPEGMELLMSYSWPGNVRQIKNLVEKLVVLSDSDEITAAEIKENLDSVAPQPPALQSTEIGPPPPVKSVGSVPLPDDLSLEAMEERFIRRALEKSNGNQRKAANLLNISRDALRYRLKKMQISIDDDDE
ncbi:MAG: sigma-54 dependent transcriptional regulator, partial [Desulfobulbaceae bacterium]|nr:sigma-54 dependent transcriptional regulator [Desulfobulbaceae bacterium]